MTSAKSRLSFEEVRESVKRVQHEGERLVGRIRRDARSLVERGPRATVREAIADVGRFRTDVRARAASAIKDLDAQRARVSEAVDALRERVLTGMVQRLNVVPRSEFDNLSRRVDRLEHEAASRKEQAA